MIHGNAAADMNGKRKENIFLLCEKNVFSHKRFVLIFIFLETLSDPEGAIAPPSVTPESQLFR